MKALLTDTPFYATLISFNKDDTAAGMKVERRSVWLSATALPQAEWSNAGVKDAMTAFDLLLVALGFCCRDAPPPTPPTRPSLYHSLMSGHTAACMNAEGSGGCQHQHCLRQRGGSITASLAMVRFTTCCRLALMLSACPPPPSPVSLAYWPTNNVLRKGYFAGMDGVVRVMAVSISW